MVVVHGGSLTKRVECRRRECWREGGISCVRHRYAELWAVTRSQAGDIYTAPVMSENRLRNTIFPVARADRERLSRAAFTYGRASVLDEGKKTGLPETTPDTARPLP